jgi:hypothetical protein
MNTYLFAAGILTALIGVVHSVMGEIMIFRALRRSTWIPTQGGSALREFQVRIIWASWHILSLLTALVASAALVLIGTRGRHPAWLGLLLVAALIAAS